MPETQQESFLSLSVLDWTEADSLNNALSRASSACDGLKNSDKKSCREEEEAEVSVVDDEVTAMVSAWNACDLGKVVILSDSSNLAVDNDTASQSSIFDPVRRMPNPAPPKRFIRSSTQTTTRRNVPNQAQEGSGQQPRCAIA